MSDTQIRMRFSAAGLKQIRDDLKAAGQDGSAAFSKVADAADKPNKALALTLRELEQVQQALRQAGREGDAAFKRIDGAVKTLNPYGNPLQTRAPIGPQTPVQGRINQATGVSGQSYSAAASANAFLELEKRATALRDALNPTAEAERKFSAAVGEASTLLSAGAITEAEHAAAVALAKKEFTEAEHAARGLAGGVALNRAQMMELGHVARSMADGLAAGQNPARLLAQEGGRLVQTMGEGNGGLSGILSKLPALLRGPIGLFGGLATAVITAALAARSYSESQEQLQRSLMGAGRATGATAEGMEHIAETSGRAGNVSVAAARQMEVAFLSTGRIGSEQIGGLIAISRDYAAAMGVSAKDATKELGEAFSDPARGADALNEKLHFLSDATRQQIRDLEESGDRSRAQTILLHELGGAVDGAADHLGGLSQALHTISKGFSDAWNAAGQFINRIRLVQSANTVADIDRKIAQLKAGGSDDSIEASRQLAQTGQVSDRDKRIADLQKQRAALQAGLDAAGNEVSTRAGDVARANNPYLARREELEAALETARKEAAQGFKGVSADVAAELKRDLEAIPRALKTLPANPEAARLREAQLNAELAKRPGAAERARIMADLEQVRLEGQVVTPGEAQGEVAAAGLRGYNRGERVDQGAARKAAAEAKAAADAQREWNAAKAEGVGVDHNLIDAENKIADLRQRGAKISAADAQAYLASAKLKDQASAIEKSNAAAKASREWSQALAGVTHESGNLDRALDLIAKRTKDAAEGMQGADAPTQAEIDRLTALATAADRAAEASKALNAAKSAVKDASADTLAAQPAAVTPATGRYDPAAALRQWQAARDQIYAASEAKIRAEEAARVQAGEQSEQQAAENTARAIAAIDAAYALQSVTEVTAIKKKAAEDVVHHEEEQQQAFNSRIAATAGDFGSAVMKLTTGAKIGNVGEELAKQILQQILETLVSDPLVALIKQELQAVMSPQTASSGGILGMLSTGLRMAFGAPAGALTGVSDPVTAYPSASGLSMPAGLTGLSSAVPDITITPPGFADGTNSTPDGLHWVGERGPELSWKGSQSIMSAADSAGWIKDLQDQALSAGAASGAAAGAPTLHYNPVIHMDATGADPAELKRTQDAFGAYQRQEPARVAAYLRAAKLR